MKLGKPNEYGDRLISEGKILEIIPLIWMSDGGQLALPPVTYDVPNWLMGVSDNAIVGHPYIMNYNMQVNLPFGGALSHKLSFLVRIMERSPDSTPQMSTVDVQTVLELVKIQQEG